MKLTATDYKKLKKRKRIGYATRYKLHLKFLSDDCGCSLVDPMDRDGNYIWRSKFYGERSNKDIAYYKRQYHSCRRSNRYKFYKKYSNRIVRRYKSDLKNGGNYRRCFDYWWTID